MLALGDGERERIERALDAAHDGDVLEFQQGMAHSCLVSIVICGEVEMEAASRLKAWPPRTA